LPRVPEWEEITKQVIRAGQAVVAHKKTVNDAVMDLDRQVDELLDKRRWLLARNKAKQN
jgi:multiple sugar transport system substrate-binding protein